MEVEGEDGSKFTLVKGNKSFFGRGSGFNTNDRTVSRHHVSFQFNESEPSRVSFQVIGRNPIWVWINKDETLKLFRKFDKGYLEPGDRFCMFGKTPFWFNLKKVQVFEHESSNSELNFDQLDVSGIDPVKEFGFLVMGQEFDQYPKGVIRNVENWQWFLVEPSKESSDEEDFEETRKTRRKRKIVKDNEDDEWTGDSEDDKDLVAKMGKGKKPLYSTRSKDKKGPNKDAKANQHSKRKKVTSVNETDEEDDNDDDETLGGFIVTDEEDDEEEKEEENDEEEEEEEEEEFEDEDMDMEE